jgi:hypothetical protein
MNTAPKLFLIVGIYEECIRMRRKLPNAVIAGGVALIGLAGIIASPAGASFPGANGRIVFDSPVTGPSRLETVDPLDPGLVPTLATNGAGFDTNASGSPDGTKLVFRSDRVPGNGDGRIWSIAANSSVAPSPPNTDGPTQLTFADGDDKDPSFIDSNNVVYSHADPATDYQIYALNLTTLIAAPVMPASGCADTEPVAGPTALTTNLIAFSRTCGAALPNLFIFDRSQPPSGTNPKNLTAINAGLGASGGGFGISQDVEPDWAPSGQWIATAARGTLFPVQFQLYAIKPDGSLRVKLWAGNTGRNDRQPAYSPDGTDLVYTRPDTATGTDIQLYETNVDVNTALAGASRPVSNKVGNEDRPAWLPAIGPPPQVPDAPLAVLLPATGLGLIVTGIWLRRRSPKANLRSTV